MTHVGLDSVRGSPFNESYRLDNEAKKQGGNLIVQISALVVGAFVAIKTFFALLAAGSILAITAAFFVGGTVALIIAVYVQNIFNHSVSAADKQVTDQLNNVDNLVKDHLNDVNNLVKDQLNQIEKIQNKIQQDKIEKERQAQAKLKNAIEVIENEIVKCNECFDEKIQNRGNKIIQLQLETEKAKEWLRNHPNPTLEEALEYLGPNYEEDLKSLKNPEMILVAKTLAEYEAESVDNKYDMYKKEMIHLHNVELSHLESRIKYSLGIETMQLSPDAKQAVLAPYQEKYEHLMPK